MVRVETIFQWFIGTEGVPIRNTNLRCFIILYRIVLKYKIWGKYWYENDDRSGGSLCVGITSHHILLQYIFGSKGTQSLTLSVAGFKTKFQRSFYQVAMLALGMFEKYVKRGSEINFYNLELGKKISRYFLCRWKRWVFCPGYGKFHYFFGKTCQKA